MSFSECENCGHADAHTPVCEHEDCDCIFYTDQNLQVRIQQLVELLEGDREQLALFKNHNLELQDCISKAIEILEPGTNQVNFLMTDKDRIKQALAVLNGQVFDVKA